MFYNYVLIIAVKISSTFIPPKERLVSLFVGKSVRSFNIQYIIGIDIVLIYFIINSLKQSEAILEF